MSALVLYAVVAVAIVVAWHRCVRAIGTAAMIVVIAMPLCFTGRALLTGKIYAPVDLPFAFAPLSDYARDFNVAIREPMLSDVYQQMIPWRFVARQAMLSGTWPLLNQSILCGDILAAGAQAAVYSPLHLIALVIPFAPSLTFSATLTFFLAGFFTFAFARELGRSETASLIAGAAFMFSGAMAFFVEWPQAEAFALLPFVLIGVRRVMSGSPHLLTIAFALEILAGHPETLLFVVFVGAIYGIALMPSRRAIAAAVGAGVIALLITAIYILPFVAVLKETIEPRLRLAHPPQIATPASIATHAGSMFFPFYGREHTALWDLQPGRVGGVALALAAIGAALTIRRRDTIFFTLLAIASAWIGFDAPPLANWIRKVPLFDVSLNNRFIFIASFALAILAAIGADEWMRKPRVAASIVIAIAITLAIATIYIRPTQLLVGVRDPFLRAMAFVDLAPLVIIAFLIVLRVPRASILILGLILMQRRFEDGAIYPAVDPRAFYPRIPILDAIPRSEEPFRITAVGNAFPPGVGAMYGFDDPRGNEAITNTLLVETYPQWCTPLTAAYNRVNDLSKPFLDVMNVKYALATTTDQLPPEGWRVIARDRDSLLLENVNAKPRAFIESGEGTLKTRRAPNGLAIDATIVRDANVVISQTAWNGWRATIDDQPLSLRHAHHAFLGMTIPRGSHRVRLTYMPRAFVIGRAISFTTLALLGVAAIVIRARRK